MDWRRSWPLLLAVAGVLVLYVITYLDHPARPTAPELGNGWWGWADQGRYYEAARAWAHGDLRPAMHWYLPGYPLIGGIFYWLYPTNPFVVPDALLLALALVLFVRLCAAMDISQYWAVPIFLLSSVVPSRIFDQYENPFTSTPVVPLIFGILLAAARYGAGGGRRYAVIAGACAGLIPLFRPSDLVVVAPVAIFSAIHAWRIGGTRQVLGDGFGFLGGFILSGACSAAAYLAIYGPEISDYIRQEAMAKGFHFSQLASKWVEIFVDPRPLYVDGEGIHEGILEAYPWVSLGIIGAVQSAFLTRRPARRLVSATVAVYTALYLSYNSLLADGVWRYNSLHYFKWTFPILAMLGFLALRSLRHRVNWPSFGAAFAVSAVPFCLHMTAVPGKSAAVTRLDDSGFIMDFGDPPQLVNAIDIPLTTGRDQLAQPHVPSVWIDGRPIAVTGANTPFASRVRLSQPASVTQLQVRLADGYRLSPSRAPTTMSTRLTPGWPCWLEPRGCAQEFALPAGAPNYYPGITLDVTRDGGKQPGLLFTSGWSPPEEWGRWSLGARSEIVFALDPRDLGIAQALHLVLGADAFVPAGKPPLHVSLGAEGIPVADWIFAGPPEKLHEVSAEIPRRFVGPDGTLRLSLAIHDPISPASVGQGRDARELGILVQTIRLDAPQ